MDHVASPTRISVTNIPSSRKQTVVVIPCTSFQTSEIDPLDPLNELERPCSSYGHFLESCQAKLDNVGIGDSGLTVFTSCIASYRIFLLPVLRIPC